MWLEFSPQSGHEQAGHRPALVLSPAAYNAKSGLMLCCPITNQAKTWPFQVPLVTGAGGATGFVLADQVKSLDWAARKAQKQAWATQQCVLDVVAKIKVLLP